MRVSQILSNQTAVSAGLVGSVAWHQRRWWSRASSSLGSSAEMAEILACLALMLDYDINPLVAARITHTSDWMSSDDYSKIR